MTGLLASDYKAGDPVIGDDPRGYAAAPHKVVDDLIERRASFGAEDIARELMKVARAPDTFARLFREAMDHPDLIALAEGDEDGRGRVYTTKTHLQLELKVMDRAVKLAFARHGCGNQLDAGLLRGLVQERGLSDEQADALRLTAGAQRLSIISGRSGSGKTCMAGVLADAHTRQGYRVLGVSPTGRGVDNLRAEGAVRALTLKGLEAAVKDGKIALDAKSVILLDEAGQIGAQTANGFLEMIEGTGAKLIAFLDTDQPGPLEASPVFRTLEARIGSVDLGSGRRQRDPDLAAELRGLGDHAGADEAIAKLDARGVFKAGQGRARAIDKLAEAYVRDRAEDKIVLAHTRRDVAALNTAIRKRLDHWFPERLADAPATAREGSVDALRSGDRIVLSAWYKEPNVGLKPNVGPKPNADRKSGAGFNSWLRPGTEALVEQRTESHVVLRIGSGDEARLLKLKVEKPTGAQTNAAEASRQPFRYRFSFADTIHGAKGRGFDSVHMLASPGLTRRLLHTGSSLCQSALNIVVPVSKDQMIPAVTAIARREDTPRSALDYGFDASAHAREVIRANRAGDRPAPTALMDGLNRTLGWVADSLDGGVQGVRETAPALRRFDTLRQGVVAELMAAGKSAASQSFTLEDRQMLETRVDALVLARDWKRFLGQGWAVRAFEAETERNAIPGVARDDQMVDRVLKRGVAMAEATGEDDMRDWFARAQRNVAAEIAAQKTAYTKSQAAAAPAQQSHPSASAPKEVVVPAQSRDYRGMALQLAAAISTHIPRADPVHRFDQVECLEEMLCKADTGRVPNPDAARRNSVLPHPDTDDEVIGNIRYTSWTTPETHSLSIAVERVLAQGPLRDRAEVLAERADVLRHLETPQDPMQAAKDIVPRLKVFTHDEIVALHEPDAPWPGSLPPRMELERAVISRRLRDYRAEIRMENQKEAAMTKDEILKDLILGDVQSETLKAMKAAFDVKELAALSNPEIEVPDSLSGLDPAMRKMIADNLRKAVERAQKSETGGAGQTAPIALPRIEMPPEPKLDPEETKLRDLTLSLRSVLTQHIDQRRLLPPDVRRQRWQNPLGRGAGEQAPDVEPLENRVRALIDVDSAEAIAVREPEDLAREIAVARMKNEVARATFRDMAPDMPHLSKTRIAQLADRVFYNGMDDLQARNRLGPRRPGYIARVEEQIDEKLSSDPPVPTAFDRAVADILSRDTRDPITVDRQGRHSREPDLVDLLREALEHGVPEEAGRLRARRAEMINDLRDEKHGKNPRAQVKDLFAVFSHTEIEALMKGGKGPLPETLPDLDPANRSQIAKSMLKLLSRIKGPLEAAPAMTQAQSLFKKRALSPGLHVDKGPSTGPDL